MVKKIKVLIGPADAPKSEQVVKSVIPVCWLATPGFFLAIDEQGNQLTIGREKIIWDKPKTGEQQTTNL